MPLATRAIVCWSGGKDSCLALHRCLQGGLHIEALLTTITADFDRVSMHGVRRTLLERQAESLGLPLQEMTISNGASNAEYEKKIGQVLSLCRQQGIQSVVFGDLFLEEIRSYREALLAKHDMQALFPLWGSDSSRLIREFVSQGFRAMVVCVDSTRLDGSFAGRVIDERFLADLPAHVDPCGESGEFHTFVFDGPIFKSPVKFAFGEMVCRDSFCFCDLIADDFEGR